MNVAWLKSKLADRELEDYNRYILPSLAPWQDREQSGSRAGSTVAEHLAGGALLLFTLRKILGLNEVEVRLVVAAFTLHDLNKLATKPAPLGQLANDRPWVEEMIVTLGIDRFFPAWRDYYGDLISLIRSHSGHQNLYGYDLIPAAGKTRLDSQRIRELTYLIRAVDLIDLSHHFDERKKKQQFLSLLNSFATTQLRWISHKLAEHRGVLSNIIHNQVIQMLQEQGARPLLVYPEGVWYLLPVSTTLPPLPEIMTGVAVRVQQRLEGFKIEDLDKVIQTTKDGIKVNGSVVGQIPAALALTKVEELAYKRKPKFADHYNKLRDRLVREGVNLDNYLSEKGLRMFQTQEDLVTGELIRATYNFLNTHCQDVKDPWQVLYARLNIDAETYAPFNALYDRPFIIAANLPCDSQTLKGELNRIWEEQWPTRGNDNTTDPVPAFVQHYLQDTLVVDIGREDSFSPARMQDYLTAYIKGRHQQDCSGAFAGTTEKMLSPQVPEGMQVQQFSNRLPGGASIEPKRYISAIAREQFFIERIVFRSGGEKAVYLHFMPRQFIPWVQLGLLKQELEELLGDQDALLGIDDAAFKESQRKLFRESFRANKGKGLSLPRFAETVAGIITMPVYLDAETAGERSLQALEYGARLALAFNLKVLISEAVIPPLTAADFDFLYIDSIPWQLAAFFRTRTLSRDEAQEFLTLIDALRRVDMALRKDIRDSLLLELVLESLSGPLGLFTAVDRALERKARVAKPGAPDSIWVLGSVAREIETVLAILERRLPMAAVSNYLKEMAVLAWQGGLRGKSLERNSLLFPLNTIFDYLRRDVAAFDREAQQAVLAEYIFDYLERIREHVGQRQADNATAFVALFYRLLDDIFQGKVNRALDMEKDLKAAFLYYVRSQIKQAVDKKQNQGQEVAAQ